MSRTQNIETDTLYVHMVLCIRHIVETVNCMVECRKITFNTLSDPRLELQELHSLLFWNWFNGKIFSGGWATSITWIIHLYYDQLHADLRSLNEGRIGLL